MEGSNYCILHTGFPQKNKEDPEYQTLTKLKLKRVNEKIRSGDFYFEGAILPGLKIDPGTFIESRLAPDGFTFNGAIDFSNTTIKGDLIFSWITFRENANFNMAVIEGDLDFRNSTFLCNAFFTQSYILGSAFFTDVVIKGIINFNVATIGPLPAVTAISPSSGPAGTQVLIRGNGLSNANAVFFGRVPASSFEIADDSTITATVPVDATGLAVVDVTATTPNRKSNVSSRYTYSDTVPPSDVKKTDINTDTGLPVLKEEKSVVKDVKSEEPEGPAYIHERVEGLLVGYAYFDGVRIGGDANFSGLALTRNAVFTNATFSKLVSFDHAIIGENALFNGVTSESEFRMNFSWWAKKCYFDNAVIKKADFSNSKDPPIHDISLIGTEIEEDLLFYESVFDGDVELKNSKIGGRFVIDNIVIKKPKAREEVYRRLKRDCEEAGQQSKADEYYFKEMAAKREQNGNTLMRGLEWLFLDKIFCYGVKPLNTFLIWCGIILIFSGLFWGFNAISNVTTPVNYVYFSIVNAMTPGYSGTAATPGIPRVIASAEAILGTFMWAAFITIFVRKYTR